MLSFTTAEQLAADLAGSSVDPNEAQKALAYLRSKRDPKAFFAYLDAIVKDGNIVIRSNQTLNYYKDLRTACQRHLKDMDYAEMAQTLGWALRLLRYYRSVPEAVRNTVEAQLPPLDNAPQPGSQKSAPSAQPKPAPSQTTGTVPVTQPAALKSPKQVGDIFTGEVLKGDDEAYLIRVRGYPNVKAILRREPDGSKLQPGNSVKVEVVRVEERQGNIILHVRRVKKKE